MPMNLATAKTLATITRLQMEPLSYTAHCYHPDCAAEETESGDMHLTCKAAYRSALRETTGESQGKEKTVQGDKPRATKGRVPRGTPVYKGGKVPDSEWRPPGRVPETVGEGHTRKNPPRPGRANVEMVFASLRDEENETSSEDVDLTLSAEEEEAVVPGQPAGLCNSESWIRERPPSSYWRRGGNTVAFARQGPHPLHPSTPPNSMPHASETERTFSCSLSFTRNGSRLEVLEAKADECVWWVEDDEGVDEGEEKAKVAECVISFIAKMGRYGGREMDARQLQEEVVSRQGQQYDLQAGAQADSQEFLEALSNFCPDVKRLFWSETVTYRQCAFCAARSFEGGQVFESLAMTLKPAQLTDRTLDLQDLINSFSKQAHVTSTAKERYRCPKGCGASEDAARNSAQSKEVHWANVATMRFRADRAQPLVVHVARFSAMGAKDDRPLLVSACIEVEYCADDRSDTFHLVHDLVSVVCHRGQLDDGHYTACVKKGPQWFACNDTRVHAVEFEYVVRRISTVLRGIVGVS
jgi:hypothetical protein